MHDTRPSLLRRFLTSSTFVALVAMGALAAGVLYFDDFGGEAEPPVIAKDFGDLTANEALTMLSKGGRDLDPISANAVAQAKRRAYLKQQAVEKKAREKAAWYKKNKKKIDANNAAAKLAKMPNPSTAANKKVGQQLNDVRGWARCWPSLLILWTKESGWNERADNPWSDAYGIPQSLPGSKMASAGPNWQTNATTQIIWGLKYIGGRYGDPCKAWTFWQNNHWY